MTTSTEATEKPAWRKILELEAETPGNSQYARTCRVRGKTILEEIDRLHRVITMVEEQRIRLVEKVESAFLEGRNVLPDATDDQAAVIEEWARMALWHGDYGVSKASTESFQRTGLM